MRAVSIAAGIFLLPVFAHAGPCPAPESGSTRIEGERARLAAGHAVQVIAGGPVALAACDGTPGGGNVPARPQVKLMLAKGSAEWLDLRTESACDTLLLVSDGRGAWLYDDDGGGALNAHIAIGAEVASPLHVWVGTWGAGTCVARLRIRAG